MRTCSKPGCERAHSAKGLCKSHYTMSQRKKTAPKQCEVEDCDSDVFARTWCSAHYEHFKRGITPGSRPLMRERLNVEPFLDRLEWLCADHPKTHVAELLGVTDDTIRRWQKRIQPTITPDQADRLENITWVEAEDNSEVVEFAKTAEGKAMIEQMRGAA